MPFSVRMLTRGLAAFAALGLVLASACSALSAAPEVIKLAEGVFAFIGEDGGTNSGFVVTDEGVVVIDSQGPKELALQLKQKIKETTDKPVIYVINTHYHGDHAFGNQYFIEARAIISHDNVRKALMENDAAHRERFKKFFGETSLDEFVLTLPNLTFSERLTLRAGERTLELVHPGPGHTYGDIYVSMPDEKIVFTGDLLYRARLPWLGDGDSKGALDAASALINLNANMYVPGHGGLSTRSDAEEYRAYLTDLRKEVKKLVDTGNSLDDVRKAVKLPKYGSYGKYKEWLRLNVEKVYKEMTEGGR
ncbi:MAG: MBL fold metallo-hydrolase [Deltaproteobacteria bacterium]|nr:MBL fold metallo-hydrolase [Deltaproteobacteria bacterium]